MPTTSISNELPPIFMRLYVEQAVGSDEGPEER
jgi:hypothetical protein